MGNKISRVERTKSEAGAAYNRLSSYYDLIAGSSESKFRNIGLDLLAAKSGEHILEIGFGTGHCMVSLAYAVGETGQVTGIDISPSMLSITKERIVKAGVSQRVILYTGDAATYTFSAKMYDAVFLSFTLELFDTPEIPVVLKKCHTALRDGGRICVVSLSKSEGDNLMVRLYEWFHKVLPSYVDCRPIYARKSLEQAGFYIHREKCMHMWGLPVDIVLGFKE